MKTAEGEKVSTVGCFIPLIFEHSDLILLELAEPNKAQLQARISVQSCSPENGRNCTKHHITSFRFKILKLENHRGNETEGGLFTLEAGNTSFTDLIPNRFANFMVSSPSEGVPDAHLSRKQVPSICLTISAGHQICD
jgi:hypothetical protein